MRLCSSILVAHLDVSPFSASQEISSRGPLWRCGVVSVETIRLLKKLSGGGSHTCPVQYNEIEEYQLKCALRFSSTFTSAYTY